jgi:hypothetical protein
MENSLNNHRERLKYLKGLLGIKNNTAFAEIIGVSPKSVKNYFENRDIGLTNLLSLLEKFPEISPDWLLLGKGVPIRPKQTNGELVYLSDYDLDQHRQHLVETEAYYKGLYESEITKTDVLEKQIDILQEVIKTITEEAREVSS